MSNVETFITTLDDYDESTISAARNGIMFITRTSLDGVSESTHDRAWLTYVTPFNINDNKFHTFGIHLDGDIYIKEKRHVIGEDIFTFDNPEAYMSILTKMRELAKYTPSQETLDREATGGWKLTFEDYLKTKECTH